MTSKLPTTAQDILASFGFRFDNADVAYDGDDNESRVEIWYRENGENGVVITTRDDVPGYTLRRLDSDGRPDSEAQTAETDSELFFELTHLPSRHVIG